MTTVQPAPESGVLTEEQLENVYVQILRNVSVRVVGTDAERQAMADAVREFYSLLTEAIRAKRYDNRVIPIASHVLAYHAQSLK